MDLSIETELEEDGRWIVEVPQLPGVLAYGATAEEAAAKAEVLALRVLAERLEQGESKPLEREWGQTPCAPRRSESQRHRQGV
jgi:predicted RNase H-like HicB family nuclease